jgi:uncharacterized protein YhaN
LRVVARQDQGIAEAQAERARVDAALAPLMARCGAADLEALRIAIGRSELRHACAEELDSARAACVQAGDGLVVEQLQAEMQGEDLGKLPGRLADIDERRAALLADRDDRVRALQAAQDELRRCGEQVDAAAAAGQRQEALAAMAGTVDRYVRVFVAARLLRWSLDRYREEKQGPLLRRAGEIFARLTRGSFESLIVDFDDKALRLKGCRAGGGRVDVEGMSEGTRDQLYLALRLAALATQLEQGRALPFVADDLFINFDDDRAFAGFQALAELATQTQVIYLTHHDHLAEVVERAIGRPLHILRL